MAGRMRQARRPRTWLSVAAMAAMATFAAVLPAAAQPPIDVRVQLSAIATHGDNVPSYTTPRLTGSASPLPPGVVVRGAGVCTQIYSGPGRTGTPVTATPSQPLPAGIYFFVPDSCRSVNDPNAKIRLEGLSQPHRIILQGGTYVVSKRPTDVIVASTTVMVDDTPRVILTASVVYDVGEGFGALVDVPVAFDWEYAGGINTCTAAGCLASGAVQAGCLLRTQHPAGAGIASAVCELSAAESQLVLNGTGGYVAYWLGDEDNEPSAGLGRVAEATGDPSRVGEEIRRLYAEPEVQIIAEVIPPGCGIREGTQATLGSLFALNCKTLKVMQVVTGIVLGFALTGPFAGVAIGKATLVAGVASFTASVAVGSTAAATAAAAVSGAAVKAVALSLLTAAAAAGGGASFNKITRIEFSSS